MGRHRSVFGCYSGCNRTDDEQPPLAVGCVGWSRYRYHVNGSRLSFIRPDFVKKAFIRRTGRRCLLYPYSFLYRIFRGLQLLVSPTNNHGRKRTDVVSGIEYNHLGSLLPAERLGTKSSSGYFVGQANPRPRYCRCYVVQYGSRVFLPAHTPYFPQLKGRSRLLPTAI